MFIILLTFSGNKIQASQFMEGHKKWIKRGIDDGGWFLRGSRIIEKRNPGPGT